MANYLQRKDADAKACLPNVPVNVIVAGFEVGWRQVAMPAESTDVSAESDVVQPPPSTGNGWQSPVVEVMTSNCTWLRGDGCLLSAEAFTGFSEGARTQDGPSGLSSSDG